jgi:hypothetical protein
MWHGLLYDRQFKQVFLLLSPKNLKAISTPTYNDDVFLINLNLNFIPSCRIVLLGFIPETFASCCEQDLHKAAALSPCSDQL